MTEPFNPLKGETNTISWHTGIPLARGGSGEVVRAHCPDLAREIAIKYLRQEEPAAIERMLREARTQASLEHPHILPVHATGIHLGRHFIAMDLVDGCPLDQALADRDVDTRLSVFDQVLDAMAYAHDAGVIHRDIKPANVLVADHDETLHAWVMDFGLARSPNDATLTLAGDALGTPGYMAPEQARGEAADARSDVHALGVVLFQLMSGKLPYSGDTAMALVTQSAAGQILPVTEIRRHLPDDLARIVVRCLEADPARRYTDAGALRRDLHRYRTGKGIEAPPLGRRYRFQRWRRAHPWRARLSLTLGVVLIASAAALLVTAGQNRRALNLASELIAEAERARGDWYVDQLLPVHDQRPAERKAYETIERLEAARADLTRPATARVDAALADLLDAIGEPERAFDRAVDAWLGGLRSPEVAARAARARLQQFGHRRLELGLSADPTTLPELMEQERQSLEDDIERFRGILEPELLKRVARKIDGQIRPPPPMTPGSMTPSEWQDRFLDLQSLGVATIERLNTEGSGALVELDQVSDALTALLEQVRSYRAGLRLACQLEVARQSLRTMQGDGEGTDVSREACDLGLVLDPEDSDLLATSSMQYWLRAKDLRRNREPFEDELSFAIAQAQQAVAVDPDNEVAQWSLGSALQVRGRQLLATGEDSGPTLQASLEWLERVHDARPNDVNVMNNLAVTWETIANARMGRGEARSAYDASRESLAWLELATENAPDDRRLMHNMLHSRMSLGYQASLLGDDPSAVLQQAETGLERLIDEHPDYISPWNTLGLVHWTQGVWNLRSGESATAAMNAAELAFAQALELRPDWESAQINLAGVRRQRYTLSLDRPDDGAERDADQALATYRQLEPTNAGKSEFDCLRAEILAARAQWRAQSAAEALLNQAETLSVLDRNIDWSHLDCRRARARIGWLLTRQGDSAARTDALWNEIRAAADDSEDPEFLLHAASFAAERNHRDLATEWLARVPELFRKPWLEAHPMPTP